MYHKENQNQRILNIFKILSAHFLHIAFFVLIFNFFKIQAVFVVAYLIFFYSIYFLFIIFSNKLLKFLFSKLIIKDVYKDQLLLKIETITNQLGVEAPQVFVLDIESFLFLTFGFSKRSGYFILLGKNILKNDQLNLDYILANQSYLIASLETALISNLIFVFSWPILLLDFLIGKLKKYYMDTLKIFFIILSLPFYLYSLLFFFLLLSKNRVIMADFFASKLLRTVNGFAETLNVFRVAPKFNTEIIPQIIAPLLFSRIPGLYFFFAPKVDDRIQYIRSIIG